MGPVDQNVGFDARSQAVVGRPDHSTAMCRVMEGSVSVSTFLFAGCAYFHMAAVPLERDLTYRSSGQTVPKAHSGRNAHGAQSPTKCTDSFAPNPKGTSVHLRPSQRSGRCKALRPKGRPGEGRGGVWIRALPTIGSMYVLTVPSRIALPQNLATCPPDVLLRGQPRCPGNPPGGGSAPRHLPLPPLRTHSKQQGNAGGGPPRTFGGLTPFHAATSQE